LDRGEAADVTTEFAAVEVDVLLVVGPAEVEDAAFAGALGRGVKQAAVPDAAFVVEEFGVLAVPVAGDLEGDAVVEGVLNEFGFVGGLFVEGVAAGDGFDAVPRGEAVVVETEVVRIDEVGPLAVEVEGKWASGLTRVGV